MQIKIGFTLLKMLLVVAAISILAGIVVVAINPGKQLADSRNTQRRSDITTILNAVYQYSIDNNGLPASITALAVDTPTAICQKTPPATCTGLVDLGVLYASEKYLTTIPADPRSATTDSTRYLLSRTANNRITVSAMDPENGANISATR